jgi:SPP1 gp7 family putative phage head morphogenesis protein
LSNEAATLTFPGVKVSKKELFAKQSIAGTIPEMIEAAHGNDLRLIINETSRLLADGHDNPAVQKALIGTKAAKYQDGTIGHVATRQETIARTAAKISEQVGMEKARTKDPDILGYFWISVLDSHTSLMCQGLSGREFYYDRSGEKPLPPQHYNCRSSTGFISKTTGFEQQPKSFDEWAKKNPEDAIAAMGVERYRLYTDGGLKIQRFTDLKAQPLTLEELKARNKRAFEKAGLDDE